MTAMRKTAAKDATRDSEEKLHSAQKAAEKPGAGEREKADLKLHEQEAAAAKLRAKHPPKPPVASDGKETKLDKALKDSFPASDPVSFVQAAPPKKSDNK
jgi:hypothetical protein